MNSVTGTNPHPSILIFQDRTYQTLAIISIQKMHKRIAFFAFYSQIQPPAESTYPYPSFLIAIHSKYVIIGQAHWIVCLIRIPCISNQKPFSPTAIPNGSFRIFYYSIDVRLKILIITFRVHIRIEHIQSSLTRPNPNIPITHLSHHSYRISPIGYSILLR